MADFAANIQAVATPQDLKNITANARKDGMIKYVKLIDQTNVLLTGTLPVFRLTDVIYRYDATSLTTEQAPLVYRPTDDNGAYIMVTDRTIIQTVPPSSAPPMERVKYIARIANPDRTVIWNAKDPFPSVPAVEDWIPEDVITEVTDVTPFDNIDIATDAFPAFTPDFVGQKIRDTVSNLVFKARDLVTPPLWQLGGDDFELIVTTNSLGGDIPGDVTLSLSDQLQLRELTNSANITLPLIPQDGNGNDVNIRVKIAHFEATAGASTTATFTPFAGTTVNGGSIAIAGSNTVFEVYNKGTKWFVK